MKTRKTAIAWLTVGITLILGPVFGEILFLISGIATFLTFRGGDIREAARVLSLGTYILVLGAAACPIGIVLTVIAAIKLSKIAKSEKGNTVSGDGQRGIQS